MGLKNWGEVGMGVGSATIGNRRNSMGRKIDPLRPARGLLIGSAIALAIWTLVAMGIVWLFF